MNVPSSLEAVVDLLKRNQLPTAGVVDHLHNFLLEWEDGGLEGRVLVGCVGLEVYGNSGLLRSVAVDRDFRSRGIARRLLENMLLLAHQKQLSSLSLLTTTAESYFARWGFQKVPRPCLPPELLESLELKGVCPDSASAMWKGL